MKPTKIENEVEVLQAIREVLKRYFINNVAITLTYYQPSFEDEILMAQIDINMPDVDKSVFEIDAELQNILQDTIVKVINNARFLFFDINYLNPSYAEFSSDCGTVYSLSFGIG